MKKTVLVMAAIISMGTSQAQNFEKQINIQTQKKMESNEKNEIKKLLFTYRDALNASDVNKVLPLYTEDGIFMPSGAPTSVGTEQVRGAYEFVFSNIELSIEFYIDEISINGDYAFARTTSKGSTLIHATGATVPEENRELFVLQKENGQWKIDRYMFNKMN
ncbi:MAG: SgcJ/EcaC family oxidoreductase [Bacteroidetes bacterium]|nr:SgcJ/EcaC family oxidoreductase [Bacteroidota bacterium]